MEIAWGQGKVDECLAWASGAGVPLVEVSRGVLPMSADDKTQLVGKAAAASFTVLTEVGSKDPARQMPPDAWADEVKRDLDAGAWLVVTEGRESGTVGTFDAQGAVIETVVDAVVDVAGAERILFEAPQKDQQAWFIRRFGPDVNLANIALDKVMALEALRLGLRADTVRLPGADHGRTGPA
jgi:phosphosulfolactate synthase